MNSLNQPVIVTEGKIFSEVRVKTEHVLHTVRIYHGQVEEAKSMKIENILDIRQTSNFELVMRIESDLKNKDREFFTDLNGFQVFIQSFIHLQYQLSINTYHVNFNIIGLYFCCKKN